MKRQWLITALVLGACGGGQSDKAPPESEVFDDLTGTLERADAVELQVLEQKDRIDQALDDAERTPDERDP